MLTKANDFSIEQRDIRHDKELIFDKKFFSTAALLIRYWNYQTLF